MLIIAVCAIFLIRIGSCIVSPCFNLTAKNNEWFLSIFCWSLSRPMDDTCFSYPWATVVFIGVPFCTTQHSWWLHTSHYYTSRRDNVPPPPISTSLKYCFRNLPSDSTWNSLRALPVFSALGSRAEQSKTRRKRMLSQATYNYGCFSYFLVIKLIILWSFRHYVGYMTRVQGGNTS